MRVFYTDIFELPLPSEHKFPMAKYRLLREAVCDRGIVAREDLRVPSPATDADLERVHAPEYVRRVVSGTLDAAGIRRIGFPWSEQLVERSRRSVGATIAAARVALEEGVAVNLAGGTHHAYVDRGGGYCVFNDAAVAARVLQAEAGLERVLVVDCDVHQGDGTAAIFEGDPSVFTFSVHGERNYPFHKMRSDLDIALPDGTADEAYLEALESGLAEALRRSTPQLAVYVSGADPHHGDRLGRLALTRAGLRRRDELVLSTLTAARVPCAVVMAGGYGEVEDVVDIHANTVEVVAQRWRAREAVALR